MIHVMYLVLYRFYCLCYQCFKDVSKGFVNSKENALTKGIVDYLKEYIIPMMMKMIFTIHNENIRILPTCFVLSTSSKKIPRNLKMIRNEKVALSNSVFKINSNVERFFSFHWYGSMYLFTKILSNSTIG